jgi:RHS repeat-associated protein
MRTRFVLALAVSFFLALGMMGALAQSTGPTPDENPEGNTGALKARIETGGGYDAHSGNASRSVTDLQVPAALGDYGLDFTRHWNSIPLDVDEAHAVWPTDFGDSGWGHSWGWSAMEGEDIIVGDDGGEEIWVTTIAITFPDGHATTYKVSRSNVYHGQWWWNLHGGAWHGPPYYASEGERDWPMAGETVRDYLGGMAEDGHEFWLYRADGGSVHFAKIGEVYLATAVFDPHGFRTDLIYNASGRLQEVRQEGGRSLILTWGTFLGTRSLITQVETRGSTGVQHVTYKYQRFPNATGTLLTLAKVTYENDPAPGQTTSAMYTYSAGPPSAFPILTAADDPRFAGPMARIRYSYMGDLSGACLPWHHPATPPYQFAQFDYFHAKPEAIAVESSGETGVAVSRFSIGCFDGTRTEYNGFSALRKFYFGRSAGVVPAPFHIKGFQLAKVTDFTNQYPLPPGLPFEHQNYANGQPSQVWDGRGLQTNLIAVPGDDSGQPSEIHHPDQNVEHYNRITPYGSDGPDLARIPNPHRHWLFSKTDERNQTTVYKRDARRRIKEIEHPDGSHEFFVYDNNDPSGLNQVTSHTLPSGAVQHYEYDGFHRLWREWNSVDGAAAYTEYGYDTLDRVATVQNPRARINGNAFSAKMEYNGRHRVTKVTYPSTGSITDPFVSYEYDQYGNCTAITNELGHRSVYTYDSYRRCTSYTEPLNAPGWDGGATVASRRWNWIYDRYIDGVGYVASSHTSREWRVQVEPVFRVDPVFNSAQRRLSARKFDCNNRIIEEVTGMIEFANGDWNTSPDTEIHYFTYDQNGQKSSYTDPRGRITTYEYDNRNRLSKTNETVNTIPRTTEMRYDPAGNKILVIFPDLRTQQWLYHDAFGQPRQFIDELGHVTDLSYWPWGPMKKLGAVTTHRSMDGEGTEDQLTRFYYDLLGRPQTTLFHDTSSEVSTYEFGQLKTWKTRRNQTRTIGYDARGRETSQSWNDGMTSGVTREWDDANRLLSITNNISALDYQYDSAGQVLVEGSTVVGSGGGTNAVRKQLSYSRYPSGEVSRLIYPNGTIVNRNYTARGQLQGVGWGVGSTSYVYLPDGKVDYQAWTSGVWTKLEYNGRGMISSVSHKNGSNQSLAYREYWRDTRDRITAWKRGIGGGPNGMEDGRGDRYLYDEEGQLKRAWYRAVNPDTDTPTEPKRGDTFQYDELGSRMGSNQVASRGTTTFTRRNNGLNQYLGWTPSAIYQDDNFPWPAPTPPATSGNGVTMAEGWVSASFNALNQPMAIWSPAYPNGASAQYMWFGFDPLGRCVKRWVGPQVGGHAPPPNTNPATYYYHDGWNLVQESSSGNNASRLYVHGGRVDEIVASQGGGEWRYHHYDARGHCVMLTDTNGVIREQYDYDAFGLPYLYNAAGAKLGASAQWGNRFLFTGREWLQDLRIYDYRNRQYQPELGRFLQPDPKQLEAGDYNLYRYCHNDPVNRSDPSGLIDRNIPSELDKKGVEASQNCLKAAIAAGDHTGRSQGIQEKDGKFSLNNKISKGINQIIKKFESRFKDYILQKERAEYDEGYNPAGVGHVHMDKTGKADTAFSDADKSTARGSAGHPGIPVYKINESNPNQVLRLTPQVDYRDEPVARPVPLSQ